jgi:hypothetical protein
MAMGAQLERDAFSLLRLELVLVRPARERCIFC